LFRHKENGENRIKIGRFTPVVVLLFVIFFCMLLNSISSNTISYYSTRLGTATNSARVAKWDVSVSIDTNNVNMVSNEWSTPYKIEITNDSEVLASYGYKGETGEPSLYSFLTFSDIPDYVSEVRIFDPYTGTIVDASGALQNNSIAIRFTGSLYPGNSRTYYVQFLSELRNGDTPVVSSATVSADAYFHFEQALQESNASIDVVTATSISQ